MIKIFLSILLFPFLLFANSDKCNIDSSILKTIAQVERHQDKNVGYQYLISFNNGKDAKLAKKQIGKTIFLDSRTIDCKNKQLCTKITNYLINEKITNLDLGAFQINYKFHKMKIENYFSFQKSYLKACSYLTKLVKEYGYTWRTIAMYHSATPKYNYNYLKKISMLTTKKGD